MGNEESSGKKSFVLYYDQRINIDLLTDEQRGKLLKALFQFEIDGKETEFKGSEDGGLPFVYNTMVATLSRDKEKWLARSNNGKQGGRPKGNQNARKYDIPGGVNMPKSEEEKRQSYKEKVNILFDDKST